VDVMVKDVELDVEIEIIYDMEMIWDVIRM